jgi:hypothetical protein
VQLHLEHVGVLGEHVERVEVGVLHPVHGVFVAQLLGGGVEERLVGERGAGEVGEARLLEGQVAVPGRVVDGHVGPPEVWRHHTIGYGAGFEPEGTRCPRSPVAARTSWTPA